MDTDDHMEIAALAGFGVEAEAVEAELSAL